MKTFLPKKSEIVRKWHILDAEGMRLGLLATAAADLLRGKHKPTFTPHIDGGDGVIVINAEKIELSGAKWSQKKYYSHSGHLGSLKEISAEKLMAKKPTAVVEKAITGMIPKNRLKSDVLTRLRIFVGAEHTLAAQNPTPFLFKK